MKSIFYSHELCPLFCQPSCLLLSYSQLIHLLSSIELTCMYYILSCAMTADTLSLSLHKAHSLRCYLWTWIWENIKKYIYVYIHNAIKRFLLWKDLFILYLYLVSIFLKVFTLQSDTSLPALLPCLECSLKILL